MGGESAGDELLTPGEVAALLLVDPKTVGRWATSGRLACLRTPGGHRRYRRSDVRAIMAGQPSQVPVPFVPSPRGAGHAVAETSATDPRAAAAVVAEAVTLALESEADQAATSAMMYAAAANDAASSAARTAERARGARAFAAAQAAQAVARQAERTAIRVRIRADVAAAQVARAAEVAMEVLTGTTTAHGPGWEQAARLLATTVADARESTSRETIRAAEAVANDVAAARAQVARMFIAADDEIERQVSASARAMLGLTAAVAEQAAANSDARAADLALAAREAAAKLLDPRASVRALHAS